MSFETFFRVASGGKEPYPYQARLAAEAWPETLVVPTGYGKTVAVLAVVLYTVIAGIHYWLDRPAIVFL